LLATAEQEHDADNENNSHNSNCIGISVRFCA
jgi:hypothetical protein